MLLPGVPVCFFCVLLGWWKQIKSSLEGVGLIKKMLCWVLVNRSGAHSRGVPESHYGDIWANRWRPLGSRLQHSCPIILSSLHALADNYERQNVMKRTKNHQKFRWSKLAVWPSCSHQKLSCWNLRSFAIMTMQFWVTWGSTSDILSRFNKVA